VLATLDAGRISIAVTFGQHRAPLCLPLFPEMHTIAPTMKFTQAIEAFIAN